MRTLLENRSPNFGTTRLAGTDRHAKLRRLLVPVDFTLATLPALRFAGTLAESFASTICLLHVIEDHPMAMGEAAVLVTKLDADLCQEAIGQLSRLARDELSPSMAVKPLVRRGKPSEEILNVAETLDMNLIVLVTRWRSGLGRLLWGSTAIPVARRAQCPVLVIRCEEHSPLKSVLWREVEDAADRLRPRQATDATI